MQQHFFFPSDLPEKIIKVESTLRAVPDEHVKTLMHFSKMTGSSKQGETLMASNSFQCLDVGFPAWLLLILAH